MKSTNEHDIVLSNSINEILLGFINQSSNKNKLDIDAFLDSFHLLLNSNSQRYLLSREILLQSSSTNENYRNVHSKLSEIIENQNNRKEKGVYFTPNDICFYIGINSILKYFGFDGSTIVDYLGFKEYIKELPRVDLLNFVFCCKVFDPTSGAGEFLVSMIKLKMIILDLIEYSYTDEDIALVTKSVFGNDIDIHASEVTKVRLFLTLYDYLSNKNDTNEIVKHLNKNVSCGNFLDYILPESKHYDIIVGNPPYIEYSKIKDFKLNGYGNIYGDILEHSIDILKQNGILGFVIPISYVATNRMKRLRNYIENHSMYQSILNYSDRPDCLFTGVHQKLSILITKKKNQNQSGCEIFISGYKYWYKKERANLLCSQKLTKLDRIDTMSFYPKVSNQLQYSIYKKIVAHCNQSNLSLFDVMKTDSKKQHNVFLNMRATFWIKAFSFNPGSSEYREFEVLRDYKYLVLSILNSSVFFMFWTMISDCWHITSKELMLFRLPHKYSNEKLEFLVKKLEKELEYTKKYIGSKQTEYVYKHRECIGIVHEIDKEIGSILELTDYEVDYIQNYALNYRLSNGRLNESN